MKSRCHAQKPHDTPITPGEKELQFQEDGEDPATIDHADCHTVQTTQSVSPEGDEGANGAQKHLYSYSSGGPASQSAQRTHT